jgi:hypothetical protein
MSGFISQVASNLYERYADGVSSLHMLFPSRRASLFFGESLAALIDKPLWQPPSVSVDDIAAELSGLQVGDRLRLVAELYKVYSEFHPSEDFDGFYFWGELLLGDFDSIDKYLVDADMLFSNLEDLHELDTFFQLSAEQRAAIEQFWGAFPRISTEKKSEAFKPLLEENSADSLPLALANGSDGPPPSGFSPTLSPEQQHFLTVWRTLGPVYHRFRDRLRRLGIAYQGMVYREAAELIKSDRAPQLPDRHYVIAGFNALSRSEQIMFEHLKRTSRVDFYWDTDDYFTRDSRQEAGMFMRDNLTRFPAAAKLSGGSANFVKPKRIRSVAAASDVLQCKHAGAVLDGLASEMGHAPGRETAVVLCDEGLLVPLLWSLPESVASVNITMGYPLRLHPVYTFVERLLELRARRRGGAFYHSDVSGLVRHPFLAGGEGVPSVAGLNFVYIGASRLQTTPLFTKIFAVAPPPVAEGDSPPSGRRSTLASEGEVVGLLPPWRLLSDYLIDILSATATELHKVRKMRPSPSHSPSTSATPPPVFAEGDSPPSGTDAASESRGRLRTMPNCEEEDKQSAVTRSTLASEGEVVGLSDTLPQKRAIFALIIEHIRRLAASIEACDITPSTKTYTALLRRSLQSVTIPFEGEPLEGVQIMGILESRALDFENIIFLSTGDSHMPGSLVGAPSFIPYNLKAAYGLPTPEHHEGVWSYHFFRLISRARRVEMVWSRTSDEGTPGTPSRYILQLEYESPHDVEKETVAVDVNLPPDEAIVVEKGPAVMSKLREFLSRVEIPLHAKCEPHGQLPPPVIASEARQSPPPKRKLSPSLFYSYTECPLKFYFRAVARLREGDEVTEGVDDPLLGNILHRSMQLLYTPLLGLADPRERIRRLIDSSEVDDAVDSAVRELYPGVEGAGVDNWGGAIMVAHRTITHYINRAILPYDSSRPHPFTIESLERELSAPVSFNSPPSVTRSTDPCGRGGGGSFCHPAPPCHPERNAEGSSLYQNSPGFSPTLSVLFSGIADRLDRLSDGTLRVVDYKTGNPSNNASALLQMGLYGLMATHSATHSASHDASHGDTGSPYAPTPPSPAPSATPSPAPQTHLYYIREMARGGYVPPEVLPGADFEDNLRGWLEELFDPGVPFIQTSDRKVCGHCPFAPVCRR